MARKIIDPAEVANKNILAQRQARIDKQVSARVKEAQQIERINEELAPASSAANAVEFMRDEFDRKNFAPELPTVKRIVYGPHPLLDGCPEFRARLEKHGLEEFANLMRETLILKGAAAAPDPIMRQAMQRGIDRFGVEAIADALRDRILTIPCREYEVEVDREDPLMLADPLRDAVERYGTPGMRPKFMSDRCRAVLGDRGYRVVLQENGDPVKVGTLVMHEIPERIALARSRRYAEESEQAVREQEERYTETAERLVDASKTAGVGFRPLRRDELVTAGATETEGSLGQTRPAGFTVERERAL